MEELKAQKVASPAHEETIKDREYAQRPGIRQQIAAGRKQLAAEHSAVPVRAAAKSKSNTLGV